MTPASRITIVEVGPRDGLQVEKVFVATESKIDLINALAGAGLRKIEATSFVSARVVPQLRDAAEVMAGIERQKGVCYVALVPNLKGAKEAIASGADAVKVVICTSDTYNRRNVGMTVEESLRNSAQILNLCQQHKRSAEAVIGLSFGCPFEGPIPPERVLDMTTRLVAQGYAEVSIADSMGLANPLQVRGLTRLLADEFPGIHFSLHVHNNRGLGLANIFAAWEEGVDTFDSSIGGLGGSEVVVAGTSGNVPTEDLLNMFAEMGVETGLEIAAILRASRMAQSILGRTLPSHVLTHGTPEQFYERVRKSEAEKSTRVEMQDLDGGRLSGAGE
jgi:hydroxymethylglutaryl-CoA lyase